MCRILPPDSRGAGRAQREVGGGRSISQPLLNVRHCAGCCPYISWTLDHSFEKSVFCKWGNAELQSSDFSASPPGFNYKFAALRVCDFPMPQFPHCKVSLLQDQCQLLVVEIK